MGEGTPFGAYLLLERIRRGGMAEVWRATRQGGDGKIIALKRLLPQMALDPDVVSMFLNEARLVAVLRHRHIAQILDMGRVGEDYFIALEYVAGEDLRAVSMCNETGRRLPLPLLALAGAQVCEALDFAHRKKDDAGASMGIIHRDVSPENCLVSFDGEAKLIDFGVAKVSTSAVKTQTGLLKGKLSYMSPEQVLAQPLDQRSDVFAMGIVLWELSTGRRLFQRDGDFATLRAVAQERIPPPGDLNPDVPPALERIILKALSRDRQQRFQWASEMAQALREYLATCQPAPSAAHLRAFMQAAFPEQYLRERERQAPLRPRAPLVRPAAPALVIPELVVPELVTRLPGPELAIVPGELLEEAPPPPTRRWKRRSVAIPIKGRWWVNERSPAELTGTLLTLSEGGAMLRTPQPLAANGTVEMSIPLGFLRRVKVRGTVRWWHRTGLDREAGVEFEVPRKQLAR